MNMQPNYEYIYNNYLNKNNPNAYSINLSTHLNYYKELEEEKSIAKDRLYRDNYLDLLIEASNEIKDKKILEEAEKNFVNIDTAVLLTDLCYIHLKENMHNNSNDNYSTNKSSYYRKQKQELNNNNLEFSNSNINSDLNILAQNTTTNNANDNTINNSNSSNNINMNIINNSSSKPLVNCQNKSCTYKFVESKKNPSKILHKVKFQYKKQIRVCSLCFKAYKNKQYCFYCGSIYKDDYCNYSCDMKTWVECDFCSIWQHIECEEQKGYYKDLHKQINENKNFKYMCYFCRSKENKNLQGNINISNNITSEHLKNLNLNEDFKENKKENKSIRKKGRIAFKNKKLNMNKNNDLIGLNNKNNYLIFNKNKRIKNNNFKLPLKDRNNNNNSYQISTSIKDVSSRRNKNIYSDDMFEYTKNGFRAKKLDFKINSGI